MLIEIQSRKTWELFIGIKGLCSSTYPNVGISVSHIPIHLPNQTKILISIPLLMTHVFCKCMYYWRLFYKEFVQSADSQRPMEPREISLEYYDHVVF